MSPHPKNTSRPGLLHRRSRGGRLISCMHNIARSAVILLAVTAAGNAFARLGFTEANIITLYIFGVLIISVITEGRIYSVVSSVVSVLVFNFLFTVPRFTLRAYDKGYPVTFLVMFLATFMTGSLAAKLKNHAQQSAQAAYRTQILLDANQLLQKASGGEAIMKAAAGQIAKLLGREVVTYLGDAGPQQPDAKWRYIPVQINDKVYGVVGIVTEGQPLEPFEDDVLLSILGECALALENDRNAHEKEEAAIRAENERLRANLLRAISHDLRTPLTSISGNASNLMTNGGYFDDATKQQIYTDIYEDSMWLISLVENLLAITRIGDDRMKLNQSVELVDEVIAEALRHVDRLGVRHTITVRNSDELLLARIDSRLIVQVVVNLIDNAVKYTPRGTEIVVTTSKEQDKVVVTIADNGPGIPDEAKEHVFEMFYTGANRIGDSRRSLGLGLSLCRSIVNAHGGEITVGDNVPHGAVFTFTLPAGEVKLHE